MIIRQNLQALNLVNNARLGQEIMVKATEKLSSGMRINKAGDDAAGLTISEKMRSQIRGMMAAERNAQDAISLIQTAEGSMANIEDMMQRIRELAIQASNDTLTSNDRSSIACEMSSLGDEIDNVISTTNFNNIKLLYGATTTLDIQVGANSNQTIGIKIIKSNMPYSAALFGSAYNAFSSIHVNLGSQAKIDAVLDGVDKYIKKVSEERSNLGAIQNRLEHTLAYLGTASENLSASESRIRDMDMAGGMMDLVKEQILSQARTAMMAQANQKQENILTLLR